MGLRALLGMNKMQNHDLESLSRYANQKTIGPGAVYYLPVPFTLPMPTRFLVRRDFTGQLSPTSQAEVQLGNVWLDEGTERYRGLPAKEILLQAKVRPFLVLRRYRLKRAWRDGPYVIGLPITSIREIMQNKPTFMERLEHAQFPDIHYLKPCRNQNSGLYKPSLVVIAAPMYIPRRYFTHFMGFINFQDLNIIVNKLGDFINDNGEHSKNAPV